MKKPIQRIVIILSIFLLVNFTVYAKNEFSFQQELFIAAADVRQLIVDVGPGSLKIQGGNVDEIIVMATIKSNKYSDVQDLQAAFEDKMVLTLEPHGSKATLKAINKKSMFSFKNPKINIDLEVTVPNNIKISVDDGSGSIIISDVYGDIDIDDGSGFLLMKNIIGDVLIDDGSGSQEYINIDGSVVIDDGSGSIKMKNVSGNVTIDDGSGSIKVEELSGVFKLIDDGSGHVYVNGKKWAD